VLKQEHTPQIIANSFFSHHRPRSPLLVSSLSFPRAPFQTAACSSTLSREPSVRGRLRSSRSSCAIPVARTHSRGHGIKSMDRPGVSGSPSASSIREQRYYTLGSVYRVDDMFVDDFRRRFSRAHNSGII
jgi:hypothetical protein